MDLPTDPTRPWHATTAADTLAPLGSRETGLSEEEARRRLAQYGPNRLQPPRRRNVLLRLLDQFNNVLIYVLLASAGVTATLGHWVDTGVILGVVLINAVIGFLQEGRAERALDAIRTMLSPHAEVVRSGERRTVAAEELVPGDIVLLRSGDRVPADLRLLRATSLQIQESALTGESAPVDKTPEPVAADADLADRASMAFTGTLVTYGKGTGVVVATGERTELGKIGAMVSEVETLTTPLLRQMAVFGRWLSLGILLIAAFAFAFGLLVQNYAAAEMFLAAVGIAVAAIPEGLPAILTIILAIGVTRMARRNAIIRRLPAVETLGSVTVICTDKTGTLTRNQLTVRSVVTARERYQAADPADGAGVAGAVPAVHGGALKRQDGTPVAVAGDADLARLLRAAVLCNDAELSARGQGGWEVQGNPTDGALLMLAAGAGLDGKAERQAWPRLDLIPFESAHKFMATLHRNRNTGHRTTGEHGLICLKGAPERVIEMCDRQWAGGSAEPIDRSAWRDRIEALGAQAERVLAAAFRETRPDHAELGFADVASGMILLGLFGLIDPPRPEAVTAVAECRAAGIRVKMITGDHAATARAIAAQVGLADADEVLTGRAIEALDDAALTERARRVDVFPRTTPEHKLRLVKALQADGQVVAMTGDGVNDAPALKRADIGIAMGRNGTEAAKEAAKMVLADDNFASIVAAVKEGRTVYDNLIKTLLFALPTNIGEALTVLAAVLLGWELPITAVQILWVNMIAAVTLGLALGFEPAEPDVMRRPPRPPAQGILSPFLVWRIGFVSLLLLAGTFGLFVWQREIGDAPDMARTVAVNALVVGMFGYLINSRRILDSCCSWSGLTGSRAVLIAIGLCLGFQLAFTYVPLMHTLFGSAPIDALAWAAIAGFAVALFLVVELEKALMRRLQRRRKVEAGAGAGHTAPARDA